MGQINRLVGLTMLEIGASDTVSAPIRFDDFGAIALDIPSELATRTVTIQTRFGPTGTWRSTGVSFTPSAAEFRSFIGDDAARLFACRELRLSLSAAPSAACVVGVSMKS